MDLQIAFNIAVALVGALGGYVLKHRKVSLSKMTLVSVISGEFSLKCTANIVAASIK